MKKRTLDEKTKEKIREEVNRKCVKCDVSEKEFGRKLDIHHIDSNTTNNNKNNLLPLCAKCHRGLHSKRKANRWEKRIRNFLSDGKEKSTTPIAKKANVHHYKVLSLLDEMYENGELEKDVKGRYIFWKLKESQK